MYLPLASMMNASDGAEAFAPTDSIRPLRTTTVACSSVWVGEITTVALVNAKTSGVLSRNPSTGVVWANRADAIIQENKANNCFIGALIDYLSIAYGKFRSDRS